MASKSYVRWSKSNRRRLSVLLGEGKTKGEIGKEFGCSANAIGTTIRRFDIKPYEAKQQGKLMVIYKKGEQRMIQDLDTLDIGTSKEYLKTLMTTNGISDVIVAREAYSVTLNITEL